MNIKAIRSDEIYRKMVTATNEEKEDIYRHELMKPFEYKWKCIGIPLKADTVGGYDVVSATGMSGDYALSQITSERLAEIEQISDTSFGATVKIVSETRWRGLRLTGLPYRHRIMFSLLY